MEGPSSMMTTDNIENKPKMDSGDGFPAEASDGFLSSPVVMLAGGGSYFANRIVEALMSKGIKVIDASCEGSRDYDYGRPADPPARILFSPSIVPEYARAHDAWGTNPPPHRNIDMVTALILQDDWDDYIRKKKDPSAKGEKPAIAEATMAILGQAAAGFIVNGLTDPDLPPWAKSAIKISVGVGLGATAAGLGMRGLKRLAQRILIKTGAISTASAIILPIAMSFKPVAAWTIGVVAWSVVATSVALA